MSLSLLQSYSSDEEEAKRNASHHRLSGDADEDDDDEEEEQQEEDLQSGGNGIHSARKEPSWPSSSSISQFSGLPKNKLLLPSAQDVFSSITGPPEFLKNCVGEDSSPLPTSPQGRQRHHGRSRKGKKVTQAGVVLEAKPQLVGIRERVRTDIESIHSNSSQLQLERDLSSTMAGENKKHTVTLPGSEDAAELLRMCVQCGIPKTYTAARGVVCPECGDRPLNTESEASKKKGSAIKDKEKNKRMKGQSSHATWKSETEMQLRQQFD